MKKISNCLVCKNDFEHWSDVSGKYCSRECFKLGVKLRFTIYPGAKFGRKWKNKKPEIIKEIKIKKPKYFGKFCKNCDKIFYLKSKNFKNKVMCSEACLKESYKNKTSWNKGIVFLAKEKNPNWKGGIGKLPYHSDFNVYLKEKIRKRDSYQCQNKQCNMTEEEHLTVYGKNLTIHHIDYDKMNCKENNLISACCACNARFNFNREYWKETLSTVLPLFLIA